MSTTTRLTLVAVLLGLVATLSYAFADGCKSKCAAGPAACACPGGGSYAQGCAAALSGGRKSVMTRPYGGGVVKARLCAGAGCCSLVLGIYKQANHLDPNASVSAQLLTASGNCCPITLRPMQPGVFCTKADLSGAAGLGVWVSGGALSDYVEFKLPCSAAANAGCGAAGTCKCAPGAAKTAACKCGVCKCSPCRCK